MLRPINMLLVCLMSVVIFSLCPPTPAYSSCGDANEDGVADIADLVYLLNYCFRGGPPPGDIDTAETDSYELLNIRDIVYLRNYFFSGGPAPICPATHPEYQPNLEPADTIKIPPTTLSAGESLISVPIYYKNSKPIRGIALPLKVNVGEQIPHIDSVALGTRISQDVADCITIDNITGAVNSGFLWTYLDSILPPGSGPLFTLYLNVDPLDFDRKVLIDTLRLAPSNSPMFIEPNTNGDLPFFIGLRPDPFPFDPAVNYATELTPLYLFCSDLDGDGDIDLAVPNDSSSDNISILKNNGNGTFGDAINYDVGDQPFSVFCADLDGDGDLDLAVANNSSNYVSILNNDGNGTFQLDANYDAGVGPASVFCADLDGDGDLDLAVANEESDNVSILKNNGSGSFETAINYGVGDAPFSVFCSDLDGDGDFDLAVGNVGNNYISILKNNGNGTFKEAVNYGAGDGSFAVFGADLDGDGDFDLAVSNFGSNNVSILKNWSQIPANQPPWAFHLISPSPLDTTQLMANFVWRIPYDPNLGDQIRYDLYISTTPGFEPQNTMVDSNLVVTHHTENLEIGTYYWKVKAKDNWGAYSWSQVTFRFFNSNYLTDMLTVVAFSPVDLIVTDPKGDSIGLGFNTIPGASYDTTQDYNHDDDRDDIITIPNRLVGNYKIRVVAEPVVDKANYSLGIRIDGSEMTMLATNQPSPPPGHSDNYTYHAPWYLRGDVNGNWNVELGDVIYLISFLYKNGPAPDLLEAGDVNCSGAVELGDLVYLISYLYRGGPRPSC